MDKETLKYLRCIEKIDFAYFCIYEIKKQIEKTKPKNNIDALIDNATGYGEIKSNEFRDGLIYQVKTIIRNKKKIGIDASMDIEILDSLKKLNTNN